MQIKEFLSTANNPSFWHSAKTLCFTGAEYPARFFTQLFESVVTAKMLSAPYQRVDAAGREKSELHALLGQSMLGSTSFFWLGNLSEERVSKSATAFKQYAASYTGPHQLAFFIETEHLPTPCSAQIIQLPNMLDQTEFVALAGFLGCPDIMKKNALFQHLFQQQKQSLDRCLELLDYVTLATVKQTAAFTAYLDTLYENQTTLQDLAECFFAKRDNAFFIRWQALQHHYPPIFWVVFWAEQLWKAIHVTQFMHQKQFVQAKKMSFRLPYSFINRDWQRANVNELVRCHEFLYQIDYGIKTGSTFCSLDLLFVHYFTGAFTRESSYDAL